MAANFLAHFDGVNGATSTVDSSGNNYLITFAGGPALSTVGPVFGSAFAHFNGSGSATIDPAISNIPAGDFTISLRFRTTQSGTAYATLVCRSVGAFVAGAWTVMHSDGGGNGRPQIYWADYSTGAPFMTSSNAGYNDGAWHMLVWSRQGNTHQMFIDGILVASINTGAIFAASTNGMTVGNDNVFGGRAYIGDIEELALFYGTSLYNANFTPPTIAYGDTPAPFPSTGYGSITESTNTVYGVASHKILTTAYGNIVESSDIASGISSHGSQSIASGLVTESSDVVIGMTRPIYVTNDNDRLAFKMGKCTLGGITITSLVDSSKNNLNMVNSDPVHIYSTYNTPVQGTISGVLFNSTIVNSGLKVDSPLVAPGYGDFLIEVGFSVTGGSNAARSQCLFDSSSDINLYNLDGFRLMISGDFLAFQKQDSTDLTRSPLTSSTVNGFYDIVFIERNNSRLRVVHNGVVIFTEINNDNFSSSKITIGALVNGGAPSANYQGSVTQAYMFNGASPLYGTLNNLIDINTHSENAPKEASWFIPSKSSPYIVDYAQGISFRFNGDFIATARLDSTFSSGKLYWEAGSYYDTAPVSFGIVNALDDANFELGTKAGSLGYRNDGQVSFNGSIVASFAPFVSANTIGITVDMDASPPVVEIFKDDVSLGKISILPGTYRPAFSFNGGPEQIYFASDQGTISYPNTVSKQHLGFSHLVSSVPRGVSGNGVVSELDDYVVGLGVVKHPGFAAKLDLLTGSSSGSTLQPSAAYGKISLTGTGYGGGYLSGKLSLSSLLSATTISPGVAVGKLKLKGVASATTGAAAIGVSKILLPSGKASGGGFLRSVSPLPAGLARGASGSSGVAIGRLVLTGSANARTYRPNVVTGVIQLPRFTSTSRVTSKISLPIGIANGRTYDHYKLVDGVPVETFNVEGWVLNLKKRSGEDPEKESFCQASVWVNFPMRQIVRFYEEYYAVGYDAKLYKMGGKTDNGLPIEWKITTAMTDFGMVQRKAVAAVYLGARIENTVTVGIYQDDMTEDPFLIPVTRGQGPHTARARLARGYDARYYGFSVSNSGGTADINTINLEIKPKERS